MARRPSKRVVMNRAALDAFQLGMADALAKAGEEILAEAIANAPRDAEAAAERHTKMLADTGGIWVGVSGLTGGGIAKVAGNGNKPRRFAMARGTVALVVGFGSPLAHLVEFGTSARDTRQHTFKRGTRKGQTVTLRHHGATPAQPFLLPAFNRRIGGAGGYVLKATAARLRRIP